MEIQIPDPGLIGQSTVQGCLEMLWHRLGGREQTAPKRLAGDPLVEMGNFTTDPALLSTKLHTNRLQQIPPLANTNAEIRAGI